MRMVGEDATDEGIAHAAGRDAERFSRSAAEPMRHP
jgi:hypothetical protein